MARKYFVVLHEGAWTIEHDGEHSPRYRSKSEAIQDAIAAASRAGKRGQDAQVIVQGKDLLFRTEWAYYGHDPYFRPAKRARPSRRLGKGPEPVRLGSGTTRKSVPFSLVR
jgi:uncharacterized protein DUF2188